MTQENQSSGLQNRSFSHKQKSGFLMTRLITGLLSLNTKNLISNLMVECKTPNLEVQAPRL